MNANRERIKSEHPDVKFTEIAKIASVEYKALEGKAREKWDKAAAADKERYEKEKAKYDAKN